MQLPPFKICNYSQTPAKSPLGAQTVSTHLSDILNILGAWLPWVDRNRCEWSIDGRVLTLIVSSRMVRAMNLVLIFCDPWSTGCTDFQASGCALKSLRISLALCIYNMVRTLSYVITKLNIPQSEDGEQVWLEIGEDTYSVPVASPVELVYDQIKCLDPVLLKGPRPVCDALNPLLKIHDWID